MLSEDDRRTLRELERRLAAEDAAFVRRFDAALPRSAPAPGHRPSGLLQIAGALVLGMLMVLAGSMAGAVAFSGAAAAIGLAVVVRQRTRGPIASPDHRPTGCGRSCSPTGRNTEIDRNPAPSQPLSVMTGPAGLGSLRRLRSIYFPAAQRIRNTG